MSFWTKQNSRRKRLSFAEYGTHLNNVFLETGPWEILVTRTLAIRIGFGVDSVFYERGAHYDWPDKSTEPPEIV